MVPVRTQVPSHSQTHRKKKSKRFGIFTVPLLNIAFWRYLYKWDDFTSIHFCKVCKVPEMLYMVLTFKYVYELSYVTIQMKPLQQYFNMVL